MDNLLAVQLPGGYNVQPPPGVPTGGLSTGGTIFLRNTLWLMFAIAVVLALIYLILGGIRWITSGGDPKAIEGARKQIMFAIVGLVIALAAFVIVSLVGNSFGIRLLGP